MRRLTTILALLGLAASISARSARADGVTYTVTSTYASDTSASAVSAPGASFTFTFTVPSPCSSSSTPPCFNLDMNVADFPSIKVMFSSPTLPSFSSVATLIFEPLGGALPGLLGIEAFPGGGDFDWEFVGPQIFNSTTTAGCPLQGGAGTLCTGSFPITGGTDFSGSFFFDMNNPTTINGDLTGGTVKGAAVTAPEPASLLLLGSGFLALGGFARKRRIARFN